MEFRFQGSAQKMKKEQALRGLKVPLRYRVRDMLVIYCKEMMVFVYNSV